MLALVVPVASSFALASGQSNRYAITDDIVGHIEDYQVIAEVDTVGAVTSYTIKFTLEDDSLRSGTLIEVDFPPVYTLDLIDSVHYSDHDDLTADFSVASFSVDEGHLSVRLDSVEVLPAKGTRSMLTVYSVRNPEIAGNYQCLLSLVANDNQLLALPKLSEQLNIKAGRATTLELSPSAIQQARAGTTIHFSAQLRDVYGNALALPGSLVTWGVIGVPTPAGIIEGGDFQAQHSGVSRVFASFQTFADTSGLIYVLPGAFAYFGLTGGADTSVAGAAWQTEQEDVVVAAYDLYGNVNYEYTGKIYFTSSDPQAQLPYTEAAPFMFSALDQGVKIIPGSSFKLFTAGRHDVTLMMNGQAQRSLFPISVLPAAVSSFALTIASGTTAGENLGIGIADAVDQYGNEVSGTVAISLSGSGVAPSGALPSVPAFSVNNGAGSGTIKLVKAGSQLITVTLGTIMSQRTINVGPADATRFRFELDAVQAVNRAFFGTAQLTALDPYDNLDTGFNAFADTVRITANGSGTVFNGVIGSSAGFSFGICDLKDFGTGYNGTEAYVTFTARSKSGIIGISPTVGFSLLKITAGQLTPSTRYIGEQYTFHLTISNFGSQPANISAIRLYGNNARMQPVQITPGLTFNLPALSSQEFTISGAVPAIPNETLTLDAVFVGQISSGTVSDSATDLAYLTILPTEGISVLASTLLPQQVSTGRGYQFVVRVRNDSDDDLLLTQSSVLTIPLAGAEPLSALLSAPLVVPGSGGEVLLPFEPRTIPDVGQQFVTDASIRLVGTLGTATIDQVFAAGSNIKIETPPVITYRAGTITPETVYRGAEATFAIGVNNSGTASLDFEVATLELTIYAGDRQLLTRLDAEQMRLGPGDSVLVFKPAFVPVDFPMENDSIIVNLRGTANGHEEAFRLTIPGNAVAIPFGAATRLVDVSADAPNMPYVNIGQVFNLSATVRNTGDEDLVGIEIELSSNGSSIFTSETTIAELKIGRDSTIEFTIEASFTPNASEVFSVRIVAAAGKLSGLAALIQPPLGNGTQAIVIQSPATLNLDARIWSPQEAQDGVVGLGELFTLSAIVNNIAQSETSNGEVRLTIIEGGFSLNGVSTQTLIVGERNFWDMTAPADEDTGLFVIEVSSSPFDLNTGILARVQDRVDTLEVISTVSQVGITVDFDGSATQLLSAGGEYDVIELGFRIFNPAAEPYMDYVKFEVRDRSNNTLAPATLIESASLLYNGQTEITAVADGDALRFNIGSAMGIPNSGVISIRLVDDPAASDFVLYLDSLSFSASYQTAVGPRPVPIAASFAQNLVIQAPFTLVPSTLTESFFAYPNPFSPLHEQSTIVYNLSSAKTATLVIYTLGGEEVLKKEIPAPASISEPVQVQWDGRNSDGQIVLNGVYLAVLSVEGEAEIRTKIAVVK
ncbi:MAG: hypothetical protein WBP29_08095 [Candidatus Zixiibacteriota bacterium]